VGGITFDSKKEAARFQELSILQRAGEIEGLQRQVPFELVPKTPGERAVKYKADFVYYDKDGKAIVEDVKSPATRKKADYIIKRKLMKLIYRQYQFIET
jgi:hypothetical protein